MGVCVCVWGGGERGWGQEQTRYQIIRVMLSAVGRHGAPRQQHRALETSRNKPCSRLESNEVFQDVETFDGPTALF
jgi:hypothetical protein